MNDSFPCFCAIIRKKKYYNTILVLILWREKTTWAHLSIDPSSKSESDTTQRGVHLNAVQFRCIRKVYPSVLSRRWQKYVLLNSKTCI